MSRELVVLALLGAAVPLPDSEAAAMTGQQLDLFHSPVETAQTPNDGGASTASQPRSGTTCGECGSAVNVMFGSCAECFAAWKAAA